MAHDDTAPEALRRAEADLAAGRAWNAANRLQSFLSHDPLHMAVRSRLGDLLLDMGAPADAGAVLLATERDDDAARGAIAAWMAYLDTHAVAALQGLRGQGLVDEDTMAALGPSAGRGPSHSSSAPESNSATRMRIRMTQTMVRPAQPSRRSPPAAASGAER